MRILLTLLLLLALGLPLQSSATINNDLCTYKKFPIFAGGNKQEFVNMIQLDPITKYILVAGKTQSANFAPAENDHGFVYAIDQGGNWMWGQFFYNVSYCVSDIGGITMSSLNNFITVVGLSNGKPIIMNLGKTDGQIQKFITIEPVTSTGATAPQYSVKGAVYFEEYEQADNNSYYYVSFVWTSPSPQGMHILKIDSSLKIVWNIFHIETSTASMPISPSQ